MGAPLVVLAYGIFGILVLLWFAVNVWGSLFMAQLHNDIAIFLQPSVIGMHLGLVHSLILLVRTETEG